MSDEIPIVVTVATEGIVDEAVVRRLIRTVGAECGNVYGKNGKQAVRRRLNGYNNAARHSPWMVLVDLDRDNECAPPFRDSWLTNPAEYMCFRIAVREVEAWLLADCANTAKFLGIAKARVPSNAEELVDPKQEMVNLARQSRRQSIRQDMVPRSGSRRSVGPAYASRLIEFAEKKWDPERAAANSDSLRSAIECLERMIHTFAGHIGGQ